MHPLEHTDWVAVRPEASHAARTSWARVLTSSLVRGDPKPSRPEFTHSALSTQPATTPSSGVTTTPRSVTEVPMRNRHRGPAT